jgi:hypothetical protein
MKSHFIGTLKADHIEGKWWRLREPLAFYSARYMLTICAPAGFVTDFASVPRLPLAWLIAGGTGHWEAVIHDAMYRFGLPCRSAADQIFFECGRVRSGMRENQGWFHRAGRLIRTTLMTGAVSLLGCAGYDPVPGCLDYRDKRRCGRLCKGCSRFYPRWSECVLLGYAGGILSGHKSGGTGQCL